VVDRNVVAAGIEAVVAPAAAASTAFFTPRRSLLIWVCTLRSFTATQRLHLLPLRPTLLLDGGKSHHPTLPPFMLLVSLLAGVAPTSAPKVDVRRRRNGLSVAERSGQISKGSAQGITVQKIESHRIEYWTVRRTYASAALALLNLIESSLSAAGGRRRRGRGRHHLFRKGFDVADSHVAVQ
jgi:hypothetical protein